MKFQYLQIPHGVNQGRQADKPPAKPLATYRYCATLWMLIRSASSAKLETTVFIFPVYRGIPGAFHSLYARDGQPNPRDRGSAAN